MVQLKMNQARNAKNYKSIYMYVDMKKKIKGKVPALINKTGELMVTSMKKT